MTLCVFMCCCFHFVPVIWLHVTEVLRYETFILVATFCARNKREAPEMTSASRAGRR